MNARIETSRFIMRPIEESDVEGIFELDSDAEVHRYIDRTPITTMQQAEEIIQYVHSQYEKYGIGRLAVEDKHTGEFVGWSGLKYETVVRDIPYYDLGYRFIRRFWGQGIATETAIASLKYGFEDLDLDKVCAGAEIPNIASNRVLEKIGMKFVETFEFDGAVCNWYELHKS